MQGHLLGAVAADLMFQQWCILEPLSKLRPRQRLLSLEILLQQCGWILYILHPDSQYITTLIKSPHKHLRVIRDRCNLAQQPVFDSRAPGLEDNAASFILIKPATVASLSHLFPI